MKGGWSYEPNYLGAELAARGVVIVTTAYRLGPLGVFPHPSFADSQRGEAIANFGFLDQIAALEWVHAHIDAFGGDGVQTKALAFCSNSATAVRPAVDR